MENEKKKNKERASSIPAFKRFGIRYAFVFTRCEQSIQINAVGSFSLHLIDTVLPV